MKLYDLSGEGSAPCYLLKMRGVSLLLDSALDLRPLPVFLPLSRVPSPLWSFAAPHLASHLPGHSLQQELKECRGGVFVDGPLEVCPPQFDLFDPAHLDVILVSSHSSLLALPYITQCGFRGVVYATEPTVQFAKLLAIELGEASEEAGQRRSPAGKWKEVAHQLPPPLSKAVRPHCWAALPTADQFQESLNQVVTLAYNQEMDVLGAVKVKAVSSGRSLGSSNWIITTGERKIVYLAASSTLTTHPKEMDQSSLKNADVMILSGLSQRSDVNPDSVLRDLCLAVERTVRGGGNCVIPCQPTGVIYDLLECLSTHLDESGLAHVPFFFLSPVAQLSLSYANILGEWCCDWKQRKMANLEDPFPHGSLLASGRLQVFPRVSCPQFSSSYRKPCVVFCGHPSLRFGEATHLVQLWACDPLSTLILVDLVLLLTDEWFSTSEVIGPFQPLAMSVIHCPIDTSLSPGQASKLLRDLSPQLLLLSRGYLQLSSPLSLFTQKRQCTMDTGRGEMREVGLHRRKMEVSLCPILASHLKLVPIASGVALSTLSARLNAFNGTYHLTPLENGADAPHREYHFGELNFQDLLTKLNAHGFKNINVHVNPSGYKIYVGGLIIEGNSLKTEIHGDADREPLRQVLREVVTSSLCSF